MAVESITEFMITEHGKIFSLLASFKRNSKQSSFNVLKSGLDRHVLAEEKAIIMLESRGKKFSEMIDIIQQHEEIEDLMKKIQKSIEDKTSHEKELKELLELMKVHVKLEDKKFYPKLDKELEGKERKMIFESLHEAIIGNIMA